MNLEIVRVETGESGTFGILKINGKSQFLTLEREWKDNRANVSCIPEGEYECKMVDSHHFGRTLKVDYVPDRSNILFHAGNTCKDSKGCILLGKQLVTGMVLQSRVAVDSFLEMVKECDDITLKIRNAW